MAKRNESTSERVASITGKWFGRLMRQRLQRRFNISREDLRAILGSNLNQKEKGDSK